MKFLRLEIRREAGFAALAGGDALRVCERGIDSRVNLVVGAVPSRVIVRRGRSAIRKASAGRLISFNGSRR